MLPFGDPAGRETRRRRALHLAGAVLRGFSHRYQLWRPKHISLVFRNVVGPATRALQDDKTHLAGAIDWLCRAQDVRDGQYDQGGVSFGWSFEDGWLPSYPETTGYIIETFIDAAEVLKRTDLLERANRMIDWELSLQDADGAFPGHFGEPGSKPIIFNTGQIIHGLLAGHTELGRQDCLDAAVRAGFWLIGQQDPDGCWRRSQYNDIPHTYDTRVSWALLRAGLISGESAFQSAAVRQLEWGLAQQDEDGWFANNAFTTDAVPFTHTIAYAISGFLESGLLLDNQKYIEAAQKSATALAALQRDDGFLAGIVGRGWRPNASFCCLTGLAQMAVNWTILADRCGDTRVSRRAERAVTYLKRHHEIAVRDPVIRGAIAGSYPIWGAYERFSYPAWAAKFFADALMSVARASHAMKDVAGRMTVLYFGVFAYL